MTTMSSLKSSPPWNIPQKEVMSKWQVCDLCGNFTEEVAIVERKQVCRDCSKLWVWMDKTGATFIRKRALKNHI
jgi:hypothetical protein